MAAAIHTMASEPAPDRGIPLPEQSPNSGSLWAEENPATLSELEAKRAIWLESIRADEELFRKHIYDKEEPSEVDFRQHRRRLYSALAAGETLALEVDVYGDSDRAGAFLNSIDQKLEALRAVLHAWHGPVDDPSIPESFRQGMSEALHGVGLRPLDDVIGDESGAKL